MVASPPASLTFEMTFSEVRTTRAPRPIGAYSQALRVDSLLFVSGQGPVDPDSGLVVGKTIEDQTARTLENVEAILDADGAGMDNVISARVYLADLDSFARYDAVYSRFFDDPKPVRTTIGAQLLGIMIEIDVVARVAGLSAP